jgi:hypothetical protein
LHLVTFRAYTLIFEFEADSVQTMLVMSMAFLPLFLGSNPESFGKVFFASQMQYLFAKSSDKSAVLICTWFFLLSVAQPI